MTGAHTRHGAAFRHQQDEHLYASAEAADFLGIHRSTLHLAVRRLKLIPDSYTPGGHARFRRETLERFSERLVLDSATGGDGSIARALASAVASLSRFTALEPVCDAVVDATLAACPSFEGCMVLAYNDDGQRGAFQLLASRGVSKQLATEYRWRRRHPGVEFITSTVAQQQARFLCGDLQAPDADVPEGGLQALTNSGWRSCAALPCISDGQTLGLLVGLGRTPCGFTEPEVAALANLADIVTVALRRWMRDEAALRQTETIGALMRHSQALAGRAVDDDISTLRLICQQGARAKVVREWGISTEPQGEAPAPLAELLRAAAASDAPQRAEWTEPEGATIALATPTPDGRAAVGAIWLRHDMRSGMELALLQVYAQACAEAAGR